MVRYEWMNASPGGEFGVLTPNNGGSHEIVDSYQIEPLTRIVRYVAFCEAWASGTRDAEGSEYPDLDNQYMKPLRYAIYLTYSNAQHSDIVHRAFGFFTTQVIYQGFERTTDLTFRTPKLKVLHQMRMDPLNVKRSDGSRLVDQGYHTVGLRLEIIGDFVDDAQVPWMNFGALTSTSVLLERPD